MPCQSSPPRGGVGQHDALCQVAVHMYMQDPCIHDGLISTGKHKSLVTGTAVQSKTAVNLVQVCV